ncbi:hypothetical protein G5C33_00945 [Sphingosinithalassobacter tenebrarum]|uniref:Uncharacterized protein n=1 Tax=Stakelama tenebrarum TaxID=2711215 RepID=A0A6G6Y9U7_9SPHN|nr:hypothetical protein G5C33_00945 [Sphingosinithalassobacter tenebrarum]
MLVAAVIGTVLLWRGPEARLRAGLERSGLSPEVAACAAEHMADALSIDQLRQLADLQRAGDTDDRETLERRMRALDDPQIVRVSARALTQCALGAVIDGI